MQVSLLEFRRYIAESNKSRHEFSSTHALLPNDLSKQIIRWGKESIPDDVIFRDPENSSFGREDEIHVTILYGLTDSDPDEIREFMAIQKPFEVRLGKITVFDTNEKFDVVKVDAQGDGLFRLNKLLKSNFRYTSKYPKYHPHVTIAYTRKGKGKDYEGSEVFSGKDFIVNEIIFSSKNGTKYPLPLKNSKPS